MGSHLQTPTLACTFIGHKSEVSFGALGTAADRMRVDRRHRLSAIE